MAFFEPLTEQTLAGLRDAAADPALRVARNAVTAAGVDAVAVDRDAVTALAPATATKIDELGVTDQHQTGRCWMFAAFNVFRHAAAKCLNLGEFEFSEAHLQFHDKVERANFVLRTVAELDLDLSDPHAAMDDRSLRFVLENAGGDGAWFPYFANLVRKYGAMPKEVFPGTESADRTRDLNRALATVLRRRAALIVAARAEGDDAAVDRHIEEGVRDAHRVATAHLGVPPETFTWRYLDKDKAYRSTGEITPQEFAARHLPSDLDEWVALAVDPREGHEPGTRWRLDHWGNVWGEEGLVYVSAETADLEAAALASLDAGEPVWFACDVMRGFPRDLGVWDEGLMRLDDVYGIDTSSTLAERFTTRDSLPSHGMAFTGVDREDGAVRAWRVENSWGTKNREKEEVAGKGYGTMSPSWFAANVFQVVVPRRHVPEHLLPALDAEPRTLPPYDLMA
ncbi:aminopeptidase C [Corynebacterium sp. 335C]